MLSSLLLFCVSVIVGLISIAVGMGVAILIITKMLKWGGIEL